MVSVVACRVDETWVNVRGKLEDPRYVFCVDLHLNLVNNLGEVGVNENDQIVSFSSGRFSTIREFFEDKQSMYNNVEAIVLLWIGSKELGQPAPSMPLAPEYESYFHPLGPRIHPRLIVADFVAAYNKLTLDMLSLLPHADVFTTDAPPQRSAGFMTNRARNAGKKMGEGPVGKKHHHFTIGHRFHGVDKGKEDRVGGKLYLFENKFENGVQPTKSSWREVFSRVYAAIAQLRDGSGDVGQLQHVHLKY